MSSTCAWLKARGASADPERSFNWQNAICSEVAVGPHHEIEQAWKTRVKAEFAVAPLYVIGRAMLLKNKRAAGRDKDLADVAMLELHTPIKKPKPTAKTRR
jgi:hypothetical protein